MSNLAITVTGQILMPQWAGRERASQKDKALWDAGQRQLQIHEDGHIQHGKDAAVTLRGKLLSLTASDCNTLERLAQNEFKTTSQRLADLDKDYDKLTQHGLRQFNHD